MKFMKLLLVMIACIAVCATDARACTKRVFRYALERWPASPFLLTVLHKRPLDDAIEERIETLCPEGSYSLASTHAAAEEPARILNQE